MERHLKITGVNEDKALLKCETGVQCGQFIEIYHILFHLKIMILEIT